MSKLSRTLCTCSCANYPHMLCICSPIGHVTVTPLSWQTLVFLLSHRSCSFLAGLVLIMFFAALAPQVHMLCNYTFFRPILDNLHVIREKCNQFRHCGCRIIPDRPPNCRTDETACTISEMHALPPKLAGKKCICTPLAMLI